MHGWMRVILGRQRVLHQRSDKKHLQVFAAHKLAGWTLRLEKKSSSINGGKRPTRAVSCSPPASLPAPGHFQDSPLAAELSAFGLATGPDACKLWGVGAEEIPPGTAASSDRHPAHKALWIYLGAVSAARLSATVLMDPRWVAALLAVMEQQGAVLRTVFSLQKGSKDAKRSEAELMEFLDNHRAAAQDCLEPGKRLEAEAAVYLCANLDALYYDLLQYHLRRGGEGPAVPPSHKYFPAVAAKHPGNKAACQRLLKNSISKVVRLRFIEIWGLVEDSGQITLPKESASANPLLAVMWSRFQEGCRLLPDLDSGAATSKRAELEQRGDVPTHRRLQDEEVLEVLGNGAKRRKLEGRGAGMLSLLSPSSENSSDSDTGDTETSGSDSDGETASATGQPTAWQGHPALRAWRESSKECHFYAYAPPTAAALDALAARAPLVEVGAGLGFWAELLRRRGINITAYDSHPASPRSHAPNEYHGFVPAIFRSMPGVVRGGPKVLGAHADHALFLCYPPPASSMAADCLRHFRGSCVCVVGEWAGDTGDAAFTAGLLAGFCLVQRVPLPNWSDTAHELTVWERKSGSTAGGGKRRKRQGLPGQQAHQPSGVTSTGAQHGLLIACCAACGIPAATSAASGGGASLMRCRWCKDVAYCSQPCSQQDAARHEQLHLLRWVNLGGSQPQWGCKRDYEPLLL